MQNAGLKLKIKIFKGCRYWECGSIIQDFFWRKNISTLLVTCIMVTKLKTLDIMQKDGQTKWIYLITY